jgi:signal transduction histidine kinase
VSIMLNAEAAERLLSTNPAQVDRLREILEHIRQADQQASETIQQLKKLLKNRSEIEAQDFDLNEAIADALHILAPEAKTRDVTLRTVGVQHALLVRADPVHLQQVILNLVANAMDAMADTPLEERRITIDTTLPDDTCVEVAVIDAGRGIPADKVGKIFDTFYTTKEHGTGLGLSIARTIVELYGGKIWAENRGRGGAVFRFRLPLGRTRQRRPNIWSHQIGFLNASRADSNRDL